MSENNVPVVEYRKYIFFALLGFLVCTLVKLFLVFFKQSLFEGDVYYLNCNHTKRWNI